jgi:Zn-dependent peptidase ImmA (M78 family)
MEQDIISYQSIFLDDVKITVIFKENENYNTLHSLFEKYGFGFYYPKLKTIIIDGEIFLNSELDMDDLRFVEAHEIGHLMLGHQGGERYDEDEIDADLTAFLLLKRKGLSTKRLVDSFEERHGIKFTPDLINKFKDRF